MLTKTSLLAALLLALCAIPGADAAPLSQERGVSDATLRERAAVVVEAAGEAVTAAKSFTVTLTVTGDGATDDEAVEEARKNVEKVVAAVRRDLPAVTLALREPEWMRGFRVTGPNGAAAAKSHRAHSVTVLGYSDAETVRKLLLALRTADVPGSVGVRSYAGDNQESGYAVALRQAIQRARNRADILSEAAKPRRAEVIAIREGDINEGWYEVGFDLRDRKPLAFDPKVHVSANVTVYYAFTDGSGKPLSSAKTAPKAAAKKPAANPVRPAAEKTAPAKP